MTDNTRDARLDAVLLLYGDAWAAWNASYHETNREALRTVSRALYEQAWRERIAAQLRLLDEQNRRLDALLPS